MMRPVPENLCLRATPAIPYETFGTVYPATPGTEFTLRKMTLQAQGNTRDIIRKLTDLLFLFNLLLV